MAMGSDNPVRMLGREQKSVVFKALTELKHHLKTNKGAISLKDLRKKVDSKVVSNEEIGLAIRQLDD